MSAPARRPGLDTVAVDGGCAVLDGDSSVLHVMNPTAAAVWHLLDGGTGVEAIAADLAEVVGLDRAIVEPDVAAVVEGFGSAGLLAAGPPGARPPDPQQSSALGPRVVRAGARTAWQERMAGLRRRSATSAPIGPFEALGFRFTVATDDRDLRTFLDGALRSLRTDEGSGAPQRYEIEAPDTPRRADRRRWAVYLDDVRVLSPATPSQLTYQLLGHLAVMAATAAEDHVLLHAAAVRGRSGAVLLPATSGAGKSTLVAALSTAGYGYLTDELVAVAPDDLSVRALRRPIVVKPGSWGVLAHLEPDVGAPARPFTADTWLVTPPGATGPAPPPAPVAAVVLPSFDPAGPDEVRRLEPLDAVAAVWEHLWPSALAPRAALDVVVRLCTTAGTYRLSRSGLDSSGDLLRTVEPPG